MASSRPSAALVARAKANPPRASETTIQQIRKLMEEVRDIDAEIESLSEAIAEKQKRRTEICGGGKERGLLVDLFEANGIKSQELSSAGNMRGGKFALEAWYAASIPKDSEKAEKAFAWLRGRKLGDIIKNTVTVATGKGKDEAARAKKLLAFLRKSKIPFDLRESVHSQTLTAEVRRRFESGQPLSLQDLETIGAAVGKIVRLKPAKEGK